MDKTLPVRWPRLLSTHDGFDPTLICVASWLPIWPWGHCPSSPTRTSSVVGPWWVSWSASILSGKHYELQASVYAFWNYSISLQPCNIYDAEKGGPEVTVSSNCSSKIPLCHKDEGVRRHGLGERTTGKQYHRFHGRCLIPCRMHWRTCWAECILLQIWLWHNGQQRVRVWPSW